MIQDRSAEVEKLLLPLTPFSLYPSVNFPAHPQLM